jgi:hypothetical protein
MKNKTIYEPINKTWGKNRIEFEIEETEKRITNYMKTEYCTILQIDPSSEFEITSQYPKQIKHNNILIGEINTVITEGGYIVNHKSLFSK